MASANRNPLFDSQREKAGAETASKFSYQYHYALYRAIQEHAKKNEYAVFVELHEDVVLADSLDSDKAQFQLNQIKTTQKKFTKTSLCSLKKGSSILGKLISSSHNKPYSSKISEINLVSVHGFSLTQKKPGLSLQKITVSDLSDDIIKTLQKKMKSEIGVDDLPVKLNFIVPDLSDKRYATDIIGEISKLITDLFPGSNYNSVDIYRVLIDELNSKGAVIHDFKTWEEVLKRKALTSSTVNKVINQFTNAKNEAVIQAEFHTSITELGLNITEKRLMRRAFERYKLDRIGNRSTLQIDISKAIVKAIESCESTTTDMKDLVQKVKEKMPDFVQRSFSDETHLSAAIICEYIMDNHE